MHNLKSSYPHPCPSPGTPSPKTMLDEGQDYNYDTFDVLDSLAMDEHVSYYDDWVADTGTTSHITN